jgi:hypothetical protein
MQMCQQIILKLLYIKFIRIHLAVLELLHANRYTDTNQSLHCSTE